MKSWSQTAAPRFAWSLCQANLRAPPGSVPLSLFPPHALTAQPETCPESVEFGGGGECNKIPAGIISPRASQSRSLDLQGKIPRTGISLSSNHIRQILFPAFVEVFGAVTNIPEDTRQHWCPEQAGSQLLPPSLFRGWQRSLSLPGAGEGWAQPLSVSIVPCWSRARHSLGWDPRPTSSSRPLPRSVKF